MTIKEIAALTGVSPTTVANVIHGRTGKMSKETLDKVWKVLNECNYTTNMGARVIGNSGSRLIGVVVNYARRETVNTAKDPFFGEIIGTLESEIRKNGYYMLLYTSGGIDETIRLASSWNVEGLILLGVQSQEIGKIRENLKIPIVYIDAYLQDEDMECDNVGIQDYEGGYELTRYLIRQGHTKIAFLADGKQLTGGDYERYRGYCAALADYADSPEFVKPDHYWLPFQKNIRHEMLRQFCRKEMKNYTALFFASDYYALDAINTFSTQGIEVPRDISVVGFDDNICAQQCRPPLTTMRQYISEKGKVAVDKALHIIRGEEEAVRNIHLPVELIIRDSVNRNK